MGCQAGTHQATRLNVNLRFKSPQHYDAGPYSRLFPTSLFCIRRSLGHLVGGPGVSSCRTANKVCINWRSTPQMLAAGSWPKLTQMW